MKTNPLAKLKTASAAELVQALFAQKEQGRGSLAALPVEENYRLFLRLQRMGADAQRAAGRPAEEPWLKLTEA